MLIVTLMIFRGRLLKNHFHRKSNLAESIKISAGLSYLFATVKISLSYVKKLLLSNCPKQSIEILQNESVLEEWQYYF